MPGSIRVSFAGTHAEAVEWCREHPPLKAPKGLAHHGDDCDPDGRNGLPMLTARYHSPAERRHCAELLVSLGWDHEFQIDVPNGHGMLGDKR